MMSRQSKDPTMKNNTSPRRRPQRRPQRHRFGREACGRRVRQQHYAGNHYLITQATQLARDAADYEQAALLGDELRETFREAEIPDETVEFLLDCARVQNLSEVARLINRAPQNVARRFDRDLWEARCALLAECICCTLRRVEEAVVGVRHRTVSEGSSACAGCHDGPPLRLPLEIPAISKALSRRGAGRDEEERVWLHCRRVDAGICEIWVCREPLMPVPASIDSCTPPPVLEASQKLCLMAD
jgi:hypothetical protein